MARIDLESGTMIAGPLWVGALIIGLPISFFFGLLIASVGSLIMPSALETVAPLYCAGEVETVVIRSNPTPGETSWSTDTFCTEADGATRSIGWPVLFTAAGIIAVFIWVPLMWWRAARRRRLGIVSGQPIPVGDRMLELERKRRGMKSGGKVTTHTRNITLEGNDADAFLKSLSGLTDDADITARTNKTIDLSDADMETKLRTIAGLRAQGLIDDETYQMIVAKVRAKG